MKRRDEIIQKLVAEDILTKEKYSSEQLVQQLKRFQDLTIKVVFEETHAEVLDYKDMMAHLKTQAERYELLNMPELSELQKGMNALARRIRGLERGRLGELYGSRALQRVHGKKLILSNISLELEGEFAECDFIAITPKGLFIIEAKHNATDMVITESGNYVRADGKRPAKIYNIGQSMNSKNYILTQKLGAVLEKSGKELNVPIQNIILFTNNYAQIIDNYHYEKVCFCSNLPHFIDEFEGNGNLLSDADMEVLAKIIREENIILDYPVEVNAAKIRSNLADVLVALESAAQKQKFLEEFEKSLTEDFGEELRMSDEEKVQDLDIDEKQELPKSRFQIKKILWNVGTASVGVVLLGVGAICGLNKRR